MIRVLGGAANMRPPTIEWNDGLTDAERERQNRLFDAKNRNGDWFEKHLRPAREQYPDKWIAVAGMQPFGAEDGRTALELAEQQHPDEIGAVCLYFIRAARPDVPCIIIESS